MVGSGNVDLKATNFTWHKLLCVNFNTDVVFKSMLPMIKTERVCTFFSLSISHIYHISKIYRFLQISTKTKYIRAYNMFKEIHSLTKQRLLLKQIEIVC